MKKTVIVLAMILLATISFTIVKPWASDATTHEESIAMIDREIDTVAKLSAGSAAASAVITLLPGDVCTPIAEQLAELTSYFLIALSALYLERYLLTITGSVAFAFLIPIACAAFGIGACIGKKKIHTVGVRVAVCALAIYLCVPVSVRISNSIYESQASSIEKTIAEADELNADETDAEGVFGQLKATIANGTDRVVDYATQVLNHFVESLAVMIVTSCVIPVLVLLLMVWMIKLLFSQRILD